MQRDYLIRVETESMLDFKRLNGFNDWFCY